MQSEIAISIPAYNDANTIADLVRDSLSVLSGITEDHQVFVINDGSTDATSQVLKQVAGWPKVHVLEHDRNRGFGVTIREVYTLPDSRWIFFIPGDGQYSPRGLLALYPFREHYDFILGLRRERQDPFMRKLNSAFYNGLISLLAGRRVRDVNSIGLLRKSVLDGVALRSDSAFVHAEIFLRALAKGARIAELDVAHQPRLHGKGAGNKLKVMLPTIRDMMKYVLRTL